MGGPDHRLTYESVKVSLITLFKSTDLDMLIAAHCEPSGESDVPLEHGTAKCVSGKRSNRCRHGGYEESI